MHCGDFTCREDLHVRASMNTIFLHFTETGIHIKSVSCEDEPKWIILKNRSDIFLVFFFCTEENEVAVQMLKTND